MFTGWGASLGVGLVLSFTFFSPLALADEAVDTATARGLGVDGVALANAGNCKEAIEKLERAETLHHAPTTATRLGECEIATGRLVRGTERLQRVIREPIASNAHAAFAAAVARAHKLLETSVPRLATLRLKVEVPPGTKFVVVVDDEPTSDALVDTDRLIDPGTHSIKVSALGFLPSSTSTVLEEGQTKSMVVELRRDPHARVAVTPSETGNLSVSGPVGRDAESKVSRVPAIAAFGLGALGLGIGVVGGVVTGRKATSLANACDANRVCPVDAQRDIRDAKTWATVSTVGFVAAGAFATTGLVLLLAGGAQGSRESTRESNLASSRSSGSKSGFYMRPSVGATSVSLDGMF